MYYCNWGLTMAGREMPGSSLCIVMGMVMDLHSEASVPDPILLISWFVPKFAPRADMKRGQKTHIADIFGPWTPADQLTADVLVGTKLPSPLVPMSRILEYSFEMRDECKIPYSTFNKFRRSLSNTPRTGVAHDFIHPACQLHDGRPRFEHDDGSAHTEDFQRASTTTHGKGIQDHIT